MLFIDVIEGKMQKKKKEVGDTDGKKKQNLQIWMNEWSDAYTPLNDMESGMWVINEAKRKALKLMKLINATLMMLS